MAVDYNLLYGVFNEVANRLWDGILPIQMKKFETCKDENEPKWIILDGHIAKCWIDNLNIALDNNKTF